MRKSLTFLATGLLTLGVYAQSFECHATGALPGDANLSCDGVNSNNLGGSGVSNAPSCGFPTNGANYLALLGNGPVTVPLGGPLPRPSNPTVATEVRIPIPLGATTLSFDWEFFARECPSDNFYNDGVSIDLVTVGGALIQNLAYADTSTGTGTCTLAGTDYCGGTIAEVAPVGPNVVVVGLGPYAPCDYVSIVVWNGGDNALASSAYVDNVVFNASVGACPPPCFAGTPTLTFSSPLGNGSLLVDLAGLPPSGTYFLGVTLTAGSYPAGWFYGIDIPLAELTNEITTGFPFLGPLGPCGGMSLGPIGGVPSGVTFYAVGLGIPLGGSLPTLVTNSVGYTIP